MFESVSLVVVITWKPHTLLCNKGDIVCMRLALCLRTLFDSEHFHTEICRLVGGQQHKCIIELMYTHTCKWPLYSQRLNLVIIFVQATCILIPDSASHCPRPTCKALCLMSAYFKLLMCACTWYSLSKFHFVHCYALVVYIFLPSKLFQLCITCFALSAVPSRKRRLLYWCLCKVLKVQEPKHYVVWKLCFTLWPLTFM